MFVEEDVVEGCVGEDSIVFDSEDCDEIFFLDCFGIL
jgi:hypothetical protein